MMLKNINIMITAGATRESIDPVRFVSNHSSGKMGFALANAAIEAGANVTMIVGHYDASAKQLLTHQPQLFIEISNSQQMFASIEKYITQQQIFISCAAVCDYVVKNPYLQKIKKFTKDHIVQNLVLELQPNIDILSAIAHKYPDIFMVGFAAETENLIDNAKLKLINKKLDMIIANDVSCADTGFNSDYNHVFAISCIKNATDTNGTQSRDHNLTVVELPRARKNIIAQQIMELISRIYNTLTL